MAQKMTINELGIDSIKLGANIHNVNNSIPFSSFKERKLFDVHPSEKYFFYLDLKHDLRNAEIDIKYAFACVDDKEEIIRITLIIDDTNNNTRSLLEKALGDLDVRADSTINSLSTGRTHFIWNTEMGSKIYMIKETEINSTAQFPVTEVHFYYPGTFENFGDYSIGFKLPEE